MIREGPSATRTPRTLDLRADLVIVGGGMAGVCCAITAARAGLKVVLVHDRPVLGGNASSEIRLWCLGATVHMISNNRWAREGGVIDEILIENIHRNREGNPVIFDTVVLEKVVAEPNITLLLNTAAFDVEKDPADPDRIAMVRGFCSQNSTLYQCHAPLFVDSSGDGILGFLSGAAFRMGAESRDEFGEGFAPTGEFGFLLGHSIYFYSRDAGRPVKFVAPSYALQNVPEKIPRYKSFSATTHGCRLWWIEWGGRLDTVHETETIKWELWRIVYGVWDYIKNSGKFPEAANLTLEWVGSIPGKRESRRFEGDYMLRQDDVAFRRPHADAVAFGGWSIDLHPADGVFAEIAGSHHLHAKGVYTIPYRCYYSRNIKNLFLSGRIISTSHVAFGTTRVMCTCAHGAQAVALAAAICTREKVLPRDIGSPALFARLQRDLLRTGHHIPGVALVDPQDIARQATISASSRLLLGELPPAKVAAAVKATGPIGTPENPLAGMALADEGVTPVPLDKMRAQMIPLPAGPVPVMTLLLDVAQATSLTVELRTTSDALHHCPDTVLAARTVALAPGDGVPVVLDFATAIPEPRYVFLCLAANPHVRIRMSDARITGVLAVGFYPKDQDYTAVGGEKFPTCCPERRPGGHNFALRLDPPVDAFGPANVTNGVQRPTHQANAWIAATNDAKPTLSLTWDRPRSIRRVEVFFDVDYDHAVESVLMGHPENAMPFCVRDFTLLDAAGTAIASGKDNHHARRVFEFDPPVSTKSLTLEVLAVHGRHSPAAVFEIRCYE